MWSKIFASHRTYLWPVIALNTLVSGAYSGLNIVESIVVSATLCVLASFGFILNDIVDRRLDSINNSGRLSDLSPRGIKIGTTIMLAELSLAIALSTVGGERVIVFTFLVALSLFIYSIFLRRLLLLANLLCAIVSTSPLWGPMAISPSGTNVQQYFIAIAAFLFVFSREIVLDVKDRQGDSTVRRHTYGTAFRDRPALVSSAILGSSAVVLLWWVLLGVWRYVDGVLILFGLLCIASAMSVSHTKLSFALLARGSEFGSGIAEYIAGTRRTMLVFPAFLALLWINVN